MRLRLIEKDTSRREKGDKAWLLESQTNPEIRIRSSGVSSSCDININFKKSEVPTPIRESPFAMIC